MNLSLQEILTQALGFLVLVWIMKRLFWKSILGSLDDRRTRIEEAFRQIENSKKEIETLRQDYQSHLEKIEEEGRAKIQAAIDEGRRISRDIQEKAREEAKEALTRSKENLALEVQKARLELRREIADLTLAATERILREKMSPEKHREKIVELIGELEARK